MQRVLFISSTGGHLNELMQLKSIFNNYDFHLVTEKTKSTKYLKEDYKGRVSYLLYGSKDHKLVYPIKLIINSFICLFIYLIVHPNYIVTTGAHVGGVMSLLAKIFGSKIIYIETFANINTKTITGKLVYHFADYFVVQWEEMLKLYPKAEFGGWIF